MDRLEPAMDGIKYEWGRGDQVRIWTMPFWLVTVRWLVRQVRRRGVVVWVAWRACMDRLEPAMDGFKYEQGRGVRRSDHVRMWTKAMVTISWLVRQVRRRGVVVWVAWKACMDGLEPAVDGIKYEWRRGVRRSDHVRMWTKAMVTIGWLVQGEEGSWHGLLGECVWWIGGHHGYN